MTVESVCSNFTNSYIAIYINQLYTYMLNKVTMKNFTCVNMATYVQLQLYDFKFGIRTIKVRNMQSQNKKQLHSQLAIQEYTQLAIKFSLHKGITNYVASSSVLNSPNSYLMCIIYIYIYIYIHLYSVIAELQLYTYAFKTGAKPLQ